MSNTVVKEKKVKKTLAEKIKELAEQDNSLDIDHASPVPVKVAKVPRKVSLKKIEPVVETEVVSDVVETIVHVFAPVLSLPVIVETPSAVEVEVHVPIVETEQEIFKRISKEKRQARLAKLTPEQLAEKKRIACEKNKTYRTTNPDKIKEKDKTYNAENKDTRKEKRDAKLKDPIEREKHNKQQRESKAKKRAEVKAITEPKPKKEKKLTKAQKKDAILENPDLTTEQKLELVLALV